jgi:hypothetical protein
MKGMLLVLLALASLLCAADRKRKPAKGPDVRIVEVTAHRSEGTVSIDGRVRNCGLKPLQRLTLIFSLRAPGRKVVTTQRGVIDDEILEPGSEAEFHWAMRDHARAVEFDVDAVDGSGRELIVEKPGPYPVE